MTKGNIAQPLKKSKSMCSIYETITNGVSVCNGKETKFCEYKRNQSVTSYSSVEIDMIGSVESDSDERESRALLADSGSDQGTPDGQVFQVLEQKMDRLNDMFQEQCRLLETLKKEIRDSKAAMEMMDLTQADVVADIMKKTILESDLIKGVSALPPVTESNSRARILLDAIEARQENSVDHEIKDALARFLNCDELKDKMVAATVESVQGVIGDCLSRDLSSLYLPTLEQAHRRLMRQLTKTVEDSFTELEENSASLSRSVYRIVRSLRHAIERHQNLLNAAAEPNKKLMNSFKCAVEELLHIELKQWRRKMLDILTPHADLVDEALEESTHVSTPSSPKQPLNPGQSIIDQLMMEAEIANQIEAGDVNAAFERALCAANLALVIAACRGGERAGAFSPRCLLQQGVLLALLQQLSTDMLHDTQLKCRYLEDSFINLDPNNAITREHVPLVVGEVRKHLTKFLTSYPSHVASRRVALIVMAADNLIK